MKRNEEKNERMKDTYLCLVIRRKVHYSTIGKLGFSITITSRNTEMHLGERGREVFERLIEEGPKNKNREGGREAVYFLIKCLAKAEVNERRRKVIN